MMYHVVLRDFILLKAHMNNYIDISRKMNYNRNLQFGQSEI